MDLKKIDLAAIAKNWMNFWQGGDLQTFDKIHHPDFVDHSSSGRDPDREGFRRGIEDLYRAFPDFVAKVDDLVIDESKAKVAIRWSASGTHMGEFLGMAASGRKIDFTGIEIVEIRDNHVFARWGEWNGIR